MQDARVYLELVRERGQKGLPLERVYRQLFHRELYLIAYGKLYRNDGATTKGSTEETLDEETRPRIAHLERQTAPRGHQADMTLYLKRWQNISMMAGFSNSYADYSKLDIWKIGPGSARSAGHRKVRLSAQSCRIST
jgi:hypothetical protein